MAHILRDDEPSAVFEYDGEAKALYYRLTREPVSRTVSVGDRVMVDVDAAGQAIGIEVLDPPGFSMTVSTGGGVSPGCSCGTIVTCPYHPPGTVITTTNQHVVDFVAKGHLGTPCPKPRDGGMCGCDEDDDTPPKVCLSSECDCV